MVRVNSRRTIRPKRIEGSREIYKAIAADAAACGMTPKQFAERFMEQAVLELRKLSWISRSSGASSNRKMLLGITPISCPSKSYGIDATPIQRRHRLAAP